MSPALAAQSDANRQAADEIAALNPPAQYQAANAELAAALRDASDANAEAAKATKDRDDAEVAKATRDSTAAAARMNAALARIQSGG